MSTCIFGDENFVFHRRNRQGSDFVFESDKFAADFCNHVYSGFYLSDLADVASEDSSGPLGAVIVADCDGKGISDVSRFRQLWKVELMLNSELHLRFRSATVARQRLLYFGRRIGTDLQTGL